MNRRHTLTLAALALALAGGVAATSSALAHGPGGLGGHFGLGRGADRGASLAAELGISVEALQAARLRALEKDLATAVDDERLTQAQVDLVLAGFKLKAAIDQDAVLAEALGISAAELEAAQDEGKTLRELLDELGLDPQAFHEARQAAIEKAVGAAVDAGAVTQAQVDALRSARDRFRHGPRGFFGGPRGRGAGPGLPPVAPDGGQSPAPTGADL